MLYSKESALAAIDRCEQAYQVAAGESKAWHPIVIGPNRPFVLSHDPNEIWGFAALGVDDIPEVSFVGTRNIFEWILDAIALPWVPFCGGHVHRDFHAGWEALRGPTVDAVESLGVKWHPKTRIQGHSLGGAFATACRAEFGGECIVFGCPRFGDADFSRQVSDMICVVNEPDIVPYLPSKSFGFADHGARILIHGPGAGLCFDPAAELARKRLAHNLESYRAGVLAVS